MVARVLVRPTGRTTACKVCNPTADTIVLKPGIPLASVERIDVNAISVMEGVPETRTRSPEEREVEWSRVEQIDIKIDNDTLTTEEKEELMDVLIDNKDLFATDISQLVECSSFPPFEIHLTDQKPMRHCSYRQTPETKAEIRRQVEALKKNGLVEPTQSLWNSPILLVKKDVYRL